MEARAARHVAGTQLRTGRPRVALIAHDGCKDALSEWAAFNHGTLTRCDLFATATTGQQVAALELPVHLLLSGPHGGDAQIGAMIAEQRLDAVVFFWDPLTTQPHDVDVKALLRLAVLYDVPTACNRSSADFLISSPLFFDRGYRAQRIATAS
jgi:methylglyoxal synthase